MAELRITPDSFVPDEAREPRVVDPVCGKEVDLERVAAQVDHEGWAFFFCSQGCHRLFTADPERFAGEALSRKDGEPR
ncbi:MAG: hypothetical protein Kow00114_22850 [Kiloniellaceae bacterium]